MIGNFWKPGSHWDFGENKNYESFAVYQQYYIKICHNNSKQWEKKKSPESHEKLKKQNKCHQIIFFLSYLQIDRHRKKQTAFRPHGCVIKSFQLSAHSM